MENSGFGSAADERQRVHLPAVAQHLEVDVRPGRAARRAHEGHGLTALHGLPYRDQRPLVMCVAGYVAVAVVDLDEIAVAGPLAGPGHYPRGNRHDVGARAAGEIHALVIRLVAAERVFTLPEVGRNKAARYGAAF